MEPTLSFQAVLPSRCPMLSSRSLGNSFWRLEPSWDSVILASYFIHQIFATFNFLVTHVALSFAPIGPNLLAPAKETCQFWGSKPLTLESRHYPLFSPLFGDRFDTFIRALWWRGIYAVERKIILRLSHAGKISELGPSTCFFFFLLARPKWFCRSLADSACQ